MRIRHYYLVFFFCDSYSWLIPKTINTKILALTICYAALSYRTFYWLLQQKVTNRANFSCHQRSWRWVQIGRCFCHAECGLVMHACVWSIEFRKSGNWAQQKKPLLICYPIAVCVCVRVWEGERVYSSLHGTLNQKVKNVVVNFADHFPHLIPINLFLSLGTVNKLFNLRAFPLRSVVLLRILM